MKRFFIHPQRRILNTAPEGIHVGMKKHLHEGDEEVEDQPDLNHLHIGRGRQGLADYKDTR